MSSKGAIGWIGIVLGALALMVGLVLTGVTLFLVVPLVVLAVPALYATWRIRRRRLLAEEDRNARELGVRKTYDHALVETVSERPPRQSFDNSRKV
jgi:membrane protein implicated in regulation of membrane protease activity